MKLLDRLAEYLSVMNIKMRRWRRVISVMSAIVVFVTTYALVLPAITLDVDTASIQSGIEVTTENEAAAAGTVFESTPEEEPEAEPAEEEPEADPAEDAEAEEEESESAEPAGEEEEADAEEPASNEDASSEEDATDDAETASPENEDAQNGSDDSTSEEEKDETPSAETPSNEEAVPAATEAEGAETAKTVITEETPLITEKTQLTYKENDKDYVVYADFDESAKLPVGVELKVREITKEDDPDTYKIYYDKALEGLKDKYDENTGLSFARFYDIAFVFEGQEIEPKGNVAIKIEYKEAVEIKEETKVDAIHFDEKDVDKEEMKAEIIDSEKEVKEDEDTTKVESVGFESDKFSVYGVVGAETFTEKFLTENGETYNISVTAGAEAHIPSDAKLEISEVKEGSDKYDELFAKAEAAVTDGKDASVPFARFFDIAIVKDGEKIQPDAPVDVKISFDETVEANKNAVFNAVHIADDGENVDVLDVETDGEESEEAVAVNAVQFSAEGFSIYGVTYTVDFETIDGRTYSIPGEGSYKLNDLLPYIIGMEGRVSDASLDLIDGEEVDGALYLTTYENGDWYINSDVAFDDTYLLTMIVDGVKYEIKVTDAEHSTELSRFIDNVSITGAEQVSGNTWTVKPDQEYTIDLHFKETNGVLQFDNAGPLTYTLPGIESYVPSSGAIAINLRDAKGNKYTIDGNRYTIDKNGNLKFYWNTADPNFNRLAASGNTEFTLKIKGVFSEYDDNKQLDFGNGIVKEIDVKEPVVGVTPSKTGYIGQDGKAHYTVTVTSNGISQNVHLEDYISGSRLTLDRNSFSIRSNKSTYDTSVIHTNGNRFYADFSSLQNGEVITIDYTASIDYAGLAADGKVEASETSNEFKVKKGDDPEIKVPHDFENNISYSSFNKSGKVSETENPDRTKTITWTIDANNEKRLSLAGSQIKDSIVGWTPDSIMNYSGAGITIVVDKGNGQTETRTATWSEVGLSNGRWAYNVPTTDGNYSYHITYTTDVDVSGLLTDTTVTNHAEDKYDDKDTSVDIGPDDENKLSVEKSVQHIDLQNNQVEWKIDVNVPKNGFTSLVVEDIFPHNDTLQDTYVEESLDVKGLVEGEDYDKDFSDPTKVRLTFKYTDSDGNVQSGVKGTGESRTITITLKTENDPGWKEAYDAGQTNIFNDHKNLAKVWGNNVLVEDDAIANLNEPEVKKSVYNGTQNTDQNTGLPMYCFKVHISQVTTDKIVIDDYFDTSVFEHTRFLHGGGNTDQFSDRLHGDRDGNSDTNGEGTAATVEEIPGGLRFTIDNVPKQGDGSYYPYYNLYYYLRLKDESTAQMLDQLAKENGGKYDVTNTAVFGDASGDATVTFEHSTMSKVGDKTEVEEGESIHFTLTINPEKLRLNGGANLELKDEIKNLSIDYHSIKISADPVGRENDITYDMSGMIMTYQIPDETKVTIEYDATAISKGEFSNKATFNGQERTAGGNVTQSSQGGGTSGVYSIYLYKYEEGKLSTGLNGAEFDLYGPYTAQEVSVNNNKVPESDMKGQPGSKFLKSFRTGEPLPGEEASADDAGKVIITGDEQNDGFTLDDEHYYFLLETKAPDGFEKSDVHYRFKIGDQANYNQYIYYNYDTLKVRNHSTYNRLIINKTISGYTGLMTEEQLNAIKASISFEVSGSFHIKDTDDDIDETITIPYSNFTSGQYILTEFVKDGETLEVKKDTSYVVKETLTDVDGFIHSTTYKINGGSPQDYQDVGASVPVTADSGSNEGTGRVSFENFYQEEKAKIKIKKVWPEEEPDAATFKGLDVVIKKDGEEYKTVTLTKEEGWEKVVENLELPGHYTVEENAIPGFTQQSIKYEVTYLDNTKEETSFLESSGEVTLTNVPRVPVPDDKSTNLLVQKNWEGKEGGPELTEAEREKLTATVELVRYRELDSGVTVHFYEWTENPWDSPRSGQVKIHDDIKIAKTDGANVTITRTGSTTFNKIVVVPDELYPNVVNNYNAEANSICVKGNLGNDSVATLDFDASRYSEVYVFFQYSNFNAGDISVSTTTPAESGDKEIDPEYDNPATVTLNSHNSWVSEFQDLPKSGKGLDGNNYVYSYGIREVSASNGFEVSSYDTGFSEDDLADGASNPSSTGMITVTNKKTKDTAPLKIKKTFEGVPDEADVSGLIFEIAGPNDFSITRQITYKDFDENGEYLIGDDLIVGDTYRVSEINADNLIEGVELDVSNSITSAVAVVSLDSDNIQLINKYGSIETEFNFSKEWNANGTKIDWPDEVNEIKIKLTRDVDGENPQVTEWISITKDMTTSSITTPFKATITNTTQSQSQEYTYIVTGLDKYMTGEDAKAWTYSITEEQVSGYNKPKYFRMVKEDGSDVETETEVPYSAEEIKVAAGDTGGVKIVNDQITVTLPETGGPGTKLFYGLGISFVGFAGLLLFIKRRELRDLSKRRW